jgi:hypothetical protein
MLLRPPPGGAVARKRDATSINKAAARATQAERGARESALLLASTRGEADEAVRKVTLLEGKLADTCQVWDLVKA